MKKDIKLINFKKFMEASFKKDPLLKQMYDDLEPEFKLKSLIIKRRIEQKLTQKQLAKQLGTKQSAISRFESGTYNPSLEWMRNMARALGSELKVTIVPK